MTNTTLYMARAFAILSLLVAILELESYTGVSASLTILGWPMMFIASLAYLYKIETQPKPEPALSLTRLNQLEEELEQLKADMATIQMANGFRKLKG